MFQFHYRLVTKIIEHDQDEIIAANKFNHGRAISPRWLCSGDTADQYRVVPRCDRIALPDRIADVFYDIVSVGASKGKGSPRRCALIW